MNPDARVKALKHCFGDVMRRNGPEFSIPEGMGRAEARPTQGIGCAALRGCRRTTRPC